MKRLFLVNKEETYTFEEFRQIKEANKILDSTMDEILLTDEEKRFLDIVVDYVKSNKKLCTIVMFTSALFLISSANPSSASDFGYRLDELGNQLMDMFLDVARWACLVFGIKDMSVTMLNGGNIKDAMNSGLMYFVGYVFISLYPSLYNMFRGISF